MNWDELYRGFGWSAVFLAALFLVFKRQVFFKGEVEEMKARYEAYILELKTTQAAQIVEMKSDYLRDYTDWSARFLDLKNEKNMWRGVALQATTISEKMTGVAQDALLAPSPQGSSK